MVLAELGVRVPAVREEALVAEVDLLFRSDPALRAVVVDGPGGLGLLTRGQLEFRLSGRLGYGRALHARSRVGELVPDGTLLVPGDTGLREAAGLAFGRPEPRRYDDFLVLGPDGPRTVGVSEVFERLSASFEHAAFHDALTGLANRRLLDEQGAAILAGSDPCRTAILYIDLDSFKAVNDTYGHRAGDEVLAVFAQRFRRCLGPEGIPVRLGGDEFAALLTGTDEAAAEATARRVLAAAREPVPFDGHALRVSATIGMAMASDIQGEAELSVLDVLLRHADGAMLEGKQRGKGRVLRLGGKAADAPFVRQAGIRRRLPSALEEDRLSLLYQPQLELATGTCGVLEALLRWEDPVLGRVGPGEFVSVAERDGQIRPLGWWTIDRACAQAAAWAQSGAPRSVAVNVSPLQLAEGTLADEVFGALRRHGAQAGRLQIEVTEGMAIADLPLASAQLGRLLDAGIGVALSDYGGMHSPLALLRTLPLSILKLDKSLTDGIDKSRADAAILAGIMNTAHVLGMRVAAVGIERPAQLAALRELGCDTAQGMLISPPLPADEVGSLDVSCCFAGTPD